MLFSKKEIIKCGRMYKIVDLEYTNNHDTKATVYFILDYFKQKLNQNFNHFSINYGNKVYRSLDGFINYLEKVDKSKLCYISMFALNENISLTITHSIRNYLKGREPKLNSFDLFIDVYKNELNNKDIVKFTKEMIKTENFDYAYLFDTDDRDYSYSEYKNSFFKKDIGFELNVLWNHHCVAVKYGFLKKLYKYNFINHSQIIQPVVNECFKQNIGKFEMVDENITLWHIDDDEYKIAYDMFRNTPWLIYDENCYQIFKKSEEAKHFNFLMG